MASITLGRVRGIPLRVHWTLLVALPLFAYFMGRVYFAEEPGATWPGWVPFAWGAGLAVFLFATVLLHELGHSLTALRYDVAVEAITLYPLGGISGLSRTPREPGREAAFTVMGPLVNFVIGIPLVALAWALAPGDLVPVRGLPDTLAFVAWAGFLNVFIGAFNLFVPAFPMDGGRLLRAGLAKVTSFRKATTIAAGVGRAFAALMAIVGFLIGNVLLILIGFFVWAGASAEEARVKQGGSRTTGHG